MSLFSKLAKRRKRKRLAISSDYRFFLKHRYLLEKVPMYSRFYNVDDDFMVIRANILIHGILNKMTIENALDSVMNDNRMLIPSEAFVRQKIADVIKTLPMFESGKSIILIPQFSRALNRVYAEQPEKLVVYPYNDLKKDFIASLIDAFDTYGYEIYNSQFTKLVKIKADLTSCAFYHIDYRTIYFINDQGRLDVKVPLFDTHMKRPNSNHIIERIVPVVDAYYQGNKKAFINELFHQALISDKMRVMLLKNDLLKDIKQAKRIGK